MTASLFAAGAGLNAQTLALMLQLIGASVTLLVFAWVIRQIFVAYGNQEIGASAAIVAAFKAVAVLIFVLTAIFV